MKVTRKSKWSGVVRTMELPITYKQLTDWDAGGKAQDIFPQLTDSQREFIMTGMTDEEWDEMNEPFEEDDNES